VDKFRHFLVNHFAMGLQNCCARCDTVSIEITVT
jgi:hypothetical protein